MTVKKISQATQNIICMAYSGRPADLDLLATQYGVSRRTIVRVLEDQNIDPGIRRRKVKAKPVITEQLPLPVDCKVTVSDRGFVIEGVQLPEGQVEVFRTKVGWIKRAFSKVSRVFAGA